MIRDLDDTLKCLLTMGVPGDWLLAGAHISFDLPDAKWRGDLTQLTVNCYLYDIRENTSMRTNQPLVVYSADKKKAARVRPPVRVDCAYCITAWSIATVEPALEEHRLLSEVLVLLLKNPTIPPAALQGSLVNQISPYPTVIASQDGVKNQPEFWNALDQKLKPSLNYVVTLAMMLDDIPADAGKVELPEHVQVETKDKEEMVP